MSAHEKGNGKRSWTGLDWIGLGRAAAQMVRRRNTVSQPGQETNSSTPTPFKGSKLNPSKMCYFFGLLRKWWFTRVPRGLFEATIPPFFREMEKMERTESILDGYMRPPPPPTPDFSFQLAYHACMTARVCHWGIKETPSDNHCLFPSWCTAS